MPTFKEFLLDESRQIDNTIKNLEQSIKNMEDMLKMFKSDREQQTKIRRIINKQKELKNK